MENQNLEKAFDSDMSGEKRNFRVHLINSPIENPWRTREEYLKERSLLIELQEKQIDALKSIERANWKQTIAFIITIVVALATLVGTWLSGKSLMKISVSNKFKLIIYSKIGEIL
jgi:hypothetical protein